MAAHGELPRATVQGEERVFLVGAPRPRLVTNVPVVGVVDVHTTQREGLRLALFLGEGEGGGGDEDRERGRKGWVREKGWGRG